MGDGEIQLEVECHNNPPHLIATGARKEADVRVIHRFNAKGA